MKQDLVVYYSNKGSNHYLAGRIAQSLSADLEEIRPRLNSFFLFLLNIHFGIKPLTNDPNQYKRVILCGPIWMGRFIPPLRSFVKKYQNSISKLVFVTCCGSTDSKKDDKFGHNRVFKKVKKILKEKCAVCQSFPVGLVLPDDKKEDTDAFMSTHLNKDNFKGEILDRYESFIKKIQV